MPPRDRDDFERRRQQIIDGAMQVFARKGFESATNRDIAQAAGFGSPGLIYHYFRDKADLFRQVLEQRAPVLQIVDHGDDLMDLPPREALTLFATSLLATLDNRPAVAMFRILLGEAVRRPAVANMVNRAGPARGFAFLNKYLSHQMDLGHLRRMHPGAASRCFIGPIIAYLLTREVYVQPDASSLAASTMVETTVDIFLKGMEIPCDT